jgi:hypothetical protein
MVFVLAVSGVQDKAQRLLGRLYVAERDVLIHLLCYDTEAATAVSTYEVADAVTKDRVVVLPDSSYVENRAIAGFLVFSHRHRGIPRCAPVSGRECGDGLPGRGAQGPATDSVHLEQHAHAHASLTSPTTGQTVTTRAQGSVFFFVVLFCVISRIWLLRDAQAWCGVQHRFSPGLKNFHVLHKPNTVAKSLLGRKTYHQPAPQRTFVLDSLCILSGCVRASIGSNSDHWGVRRGT